MQLDRYLKILVQDLTKYVAISEEFPANTIGKLKSGGLLFNRRVTRVVTPGTLIDESFMDPCLNNFLLAVHCGDGPSMIDEDMTINLNGGLGGIDNVGTNPVGLAWLDLSTGDFFTQSTTLSSLSSAIARIDPREIIVETNLQSKPEFKQLSETLKDYQHLLSFHSSSCSISKISDWAPMLEGVIARSSEAEFAEEEVVAGSSLLDFVNEQLQGGKMKLQPPIRRQANENMGIDRNTLRALEIKTTARDGNAKGSLLHAIRRTVTKSGSRLLTDWLGTISVLLFLASKPDTTQSTTWLTP